MVLTDLSEQRREHALLREAARALRVGLRLGGDRDGAGPDGRFMQVNPALCELTGYPERELLDKTLLDISHPDDRELGGGEQRELQAGDTDQAAAAVLLELGDER